MVENKLLKYGGIGLMLVGVIVVISSAAIVQQSIVSVGPVSADIPPVNAVRLITGAVLFGLGLLGYKNK